MAAADLISWGIGSPASIRAFILDGLSTNAGASDTTPDQFGFTDRTGVARSTVTTSNTLTLAGTDADADISIVGATAEYQIAGGAWASASGTISAGQTFAVRITSSASYNTSVNAILTIGGVTDTFTVQTLVDPASTTRKILRRILRATRRAFY